MEKREFLEQLVSQASLDTIDFACDLELVLAEEVRYLRRVIEALVDHDASADETLTQELRARLTDKDAEIARLLEENRFLRERVAARSG
jgi:flagellar biosynthesis regulator FlaF